jgi:hypothetical protein
LVAHRDTVETVEALESLKPLGQLNCQEPLETDETARLLIWQRPFSAVSVWVTEVAGPDGTDETTDLWPPV